jgi:tryptophan synthase alpha chain
MSRIAERFATLKARRESALIPFIVAGDPSMAVTIRVMAALARAGADIIELGVPFSDPLADGPVNQAAYDRALRAGATVEGLFNLVARFRREHQTPIVLMTYSNPVAQHGWAEFAKSAAQAGVDGVLVTDLPPEEAQPWLDRARAAGLDTIFLLAPTSPEERIAVVARHATGYIYCVSRLGVTGVRDQLPPDARALVERVRAVQAERRAPALPVVVGFGIARPEQVRAVCEFADGAVVGSALVQLIAEHAESADLDATLERFAADLKAATGPAAR